MSLKRFQKDEIEKKVSATLKDPRAIEKIARADAASVIRGKISKRFFDDVYTVTYSADDLERRPFLNIGPGSFRHPRWRTADKKYGDDNAAWTEMRRGIAQDPVDYYWDIYSGEKMPETAGFFKVIYTSHVIEHLFPKDVDFLLAEAFRLLEPGGKIRIVCPDAEQMANAYHDSDWSYFMHYLIAKTGRRSAPLSSADPRKLKEESADFLLDWVSLLTNSKNQTYIRGRQCVDFLAQHSTLFEAFDKATALSSRELNQSVGGHVNWFSGEKLTGLLRNCGFSKVEISGYQKSSSPILRDGRFFDRTDPEMSLFVEATK